MGTLSHTGGKVDYNNHFGKLAGNISPKPNIQLPYDQKSSPPCFSCRCLAAK